MKQTCENKGNKVNSLEKAEVIFLYACSGGLVMVSLLLAVAIVDAVMRLLP